MGQLPNNPKKSLPGASPWAMVGVGAELVVTVLAFVFLGRWADGKLGSEPWLLLLGIFAGITLGIYQILRKSQPSKKGSS